MKKILIIEDEFLIQQSLKKMLEKRGHQVFVASSGLKGLDIIKAAPLDKIICDLMLQDISGFDVIEESKFHLGSENIPKKFVIITAYNSQQVLDKASSYKCLVINKPFDNLEKALDLMVD